MANPLNPTSTYAGDLALPYIHAAVISAPTLHGGNVTLLDGIRYKAIIPRMSFGAGAAALIKAGACDFDVTATTTLEEASLDITDQMVNLQLCKREFRTWWQGDAYSINSGVPDDYADAILLYVAKFVQADIENNIWMGNATASVYTAFNGLKLASGNTAGATPLVNAIDAAATVLLGLQEMITAMPAGIVGDFENTNLYVANKNNVFVGIGTADSDSMAQAIDMTPLDGSDNYRITMRFGVGTAIGVVADTVWFV